MSPAAARRTERTRRYRERVARGEKIAPTPYDNRVLELLIALEWLALAKSEDCQEVGKAIAAMLADAAAKHRSCDA